MIALCSAFKKGLVAIKIDNKEDFFEVDANCGHSEKMLPAIDYILRKNELVLAQNESFGVVVGPGSFTGIRIAMAIVKGLCAGNDNAEKIYPITTFELMAYTYINNFHPKNNFTCIINALSGKVFACQFNMKGEKLREEKIINSDLVEKDFVGLKEEGLTGVLVDPSAKDLLELAIQKEQLQNPIKIENLSPMYLRKSQAEDDLEKREKNIKKI